VELQLLDHEARDDLFISVHLKARFLGDELRLAKRNVSSRMPW